MCEYNDTIKCTCHNTGCEFFAKCCECVAKHRDKGQFPGCFYSPEYVTKGRSYELLVEDRSR